MAEPKTDVPNGPDAPDNQRPDRPEGLTEGYEGDYIVLMPRDPEWLHAYWEMPKERVEAALGELGVSADEAELQLRLYNVTDLLDPTSGRPRLEDATDVVVVKVDASADHWYIKAGGAEQLYCVEYAVTAPDGRTVALALSNLAATPSDRAADVGEETWVTSAVENGETSKTQGLVETKWMKGNENMHEALSSSGSAQMSAEPPSSESNA